MKSIPKVSYPLSLDSDYTLFKTYNSTKSVLAKDLPEGQDFVYIVPQNANKPEIWADNGFATIDDELIYYDEVEKNQDGKVFCLKDCIRGVEGTQKFYRAGTIVKSNVTAQTHNQLVEAVVAIEKTLGEVGDMLKLGPMLKAQRNVKKSFVPLSTRATEIDHAFTASLQQSLTNILGVAGINEDACPEVEFELNNIGDTAEYCVRIFGAYTSFSIDFDDGTVINNQLSGTHTYAGNGPYNPTITVNSSTCTIVQMPTTPNEFTEGPILPSPAVPFIVSIPDFPDMPSFAPPSTTCPGPLFNLPPIMFPDVTLCSSSFMSYSCTPSVIISVIEACTTPQIISISSPCVLSDISLLGIPSSITLIGSIPSVISVIAPSFDCISFCEVPSFDCISFCNIPSFECISFCDIPSFDCISFCNIPSFDVISFAPFPSINPVSFEVMVDLSISPVCFCDPPSFQPISFGTPPSISVVWGVPPTVSCVVTVQCPGGASTSPSGTGTQMGFAAMGMLDSTDFQDTGIPVNIGDIGIPDEIVLKHNLHREINIKHDIPKTIEFNSKITIDADNLPSSILLEPSPNLPSKFMLEVVGMSPTIEVVGMPKTIEVIGMPSTLQLVMPENPVVKMEWDGVPVQMKFAPEVEKLLSTLTIQPR